MGAAGVWLLLVTFYNLGVDEKARHILVYALPVAAVAWTHLLRAFGVAGLATASAWWGGALHTSMAAPPTLDVWLFAYAKLSVIAWGVHHVARRCRQAAEVSGP